jgi:hypothetical protein
MEVTVSSAPLRLGGRSRPQQSDGDDARLVAPVAPGVASAVLDHAVTGTKVDLGTVVELQPDLT